MDCNCEYLKNKHIRLNCINCGGYVSYSKTSTINDNEDKNIILEKLKKQLNEKLAEVAVLRLDIRELRNEIEDIDKI